MVRIGLTVDEFVDLKIKPRASADRAISWSTTRRQLCLSFNPRPRGAGDDEMDDEQRLLVRFQSALEIAATSVQANGEVDPAAVAVEVDVADGLRVAVARHQVVTALANVLKNAYEAFVGGWPRHTEAVAGNAAVVDGAADAAPEPGPPTAAPIDAVPQAGSTSSVATQRSQIAITARRAGETVVLVIRDNGMGFAQEEADALHLFTPGRRNKTKRNSTGYGLPNAARKIMAQGGSIQFESREGRGAVVTVRLPVASEGCAP